MVMTNSIQIEWDAAVCVPIWDGLPISLWSGVVLMGGSMSNSSSLFSKVLLSHSKISNTLRQGSETLRGS